LIVADAASIGCVISTNAEAGSFRHEGTPPARV
jgi:hypothetical protein